MDGLIMILYYPYTFAHIKEHLPNSANIYQRQLDGILNITSKDTFDSRKMEITEG